MTYRVPVVLTQAQAAALKREMRAKEADQALKKLAVLFVGGLMVAAAIRGDQEKKRKNRRSK